jgi:hypothetical protein
MWNFGKGSEFNDTQISYKEKLEGWFLLTDM